MSKKSQHRDSQGFTLFEVALVIVIIGALMIPLVRLYESYLSGQKLDITQQHLLAMEDIISSSHDASIPPHYVCPSDRALPPSNPEYRKEFNGGNCKIADLATRFGYGSTAALEAAVTAATPVCSPNFGFCIALGPPVQTVPGTFDKDFDGSGKPDFILIGGVPIIDALIDVASADGNIYPVSDVLDGWDHNFTYAVALDLVSDNPYNINKNGGIAVTDENIQPTAGINNDGHFVIVSHGPDGNGAYTRAGILAAPCGLNADSENCNNDYKFKSALGFYMANTTQYFDDILYASKKIDTGIWENIYSGSTNTGHLHNLNTENVGINTSTPITKLDVSGTTAADYNSLATQICKNNGTATGTECFDITKITSTGINRINCPAGQIMTGISKGLAVCANPPAPTASRVPVINCNDGTHGADIYVHGFNIVTGAAICGH